MRKPRKTINRCGTCRYFLQGIVRDAYGATYRASRCTNSKSDRIEVRSNKGACRCWAKKLLPSSGDYCYFIQQRIKYDEGEGVESLPCYTCNARCVFSVSKVETDFTQRHKRVMSVDEYRENLCE